MTDSTFHQPKKRWRYAFMVLIAHFLLGSYQVSGQDSQYWSITYGTKATLLGGAVIGSVSDLSATYYNPGAVALFENPKLIISAKVYEYERVKIENGGGINKNLLSDKFSTVPNFFAFKIKLDSTSRNKLAISVLTRQALNLNLFTKGIVTQEDPVNGLSTTSGFFKGYQFLNEMWGGVTYSHRYNEHIGLGITGYGAYRFQDLERQFSVHQLVGTNEINTYDYIRNFYFTDYRILFKTGLAIKLLPFTLGLNLTTPSLHVLGSGVYNFSEVSVDADSVSNNSYQADIQDSLKACFKSPLAIGIGAAYWHKKYNLHFSAEWYSAINNYHPMVVKPFVAQGNGDTIYNQVNHRTYGVLNAGIGVDYIINATTDVSAGITTDFSANAPDLSSNILLTSWDIYHFSMGSNFKIGRGEITLGLSYSTGRDFINQQVDITDINNITNPFNPILNTRFRRVKLLFGFIF